MPRKFTAAEKRLAMKLVSFLKRVAMNDRPGIRHVSLGLRVTPATTFIAVSGITHSALVAYRLEGIKDELRTTRTCRFCGCSEVFACPGGCGWLKRDVCTRCGPRYEAEKERRARRNS
jgi:hypothetical protein